MVLADRLRKEGEIKGKEEGLKQGKEEGLKEGEIKGAISAWERILDKGPSLSKEMAAMARQNIAELSLRLQQVSA